MPKGVATIRRVAAHDRVWIKICSSARIVGAEAAWHRASSEGSGLAGLRFVETGWFDNSWKIP
jgi:hypothetical protein